MENAVVGMMQQRKGHPSFMADLNSLKDAVSILSQNYLVTFRVVLPRNRE